MHVKYAQKLITQVEKNMNGYKMDDLQNLIIEIRDEREIRTAQKAYKCFFTKSAAVCNLNNPSPLILCGSRGLQRAVVWSAR